ncbi:MAG: glycoside hydrolase family 2 protein [Chloroflexi bacterium]|nr:glycoside hydrolase family 2 protein [Chloroflexota bacterium]
MTKRISLDGQWEFQEAGSAHWQVGTVPGCVQMDLLALGQLPDPFIGMNEIEMHRLEDKAWSYRKTFTLSEKNLEQDSLDLVFEGIDTLADVYLNDSLLGHVNDMFIPQRFDISEHAQVGDNLVEVRFDSPINTIRAIERTSPVKLSSSAENARVYVRKAQYSYGWDWGPRIAQTGLWRPVYIEMSSGARILHPYAWTVELKENQAHVRVSATIEPFADAAYVAEIALSLNGKVIAYAAVDAQSSGEFDYQVQADFFIDDPELWWPNGMGAQPLYEVGIKVGDGQKWFDRASFRTGIRTVKLIQEADEEGSTFIFAVNGIKVFCKGANWIPGDSLLPRLKRDDYYQLVGLAQGANMNMLRIWGGGIYEDPAFYDACDEMGILIWQDFMYACAQYPDEFDWFQHLAYDEAEVVVTALRNHPSLALWCGNNENNWGFDEWWKVGEPKYLGNYIYREILPTVCAGLDPSRPYWVSSPYGGEHPNGKSEGDTHSWNVWSSWQDYSGYLHDTGRFISEFGFQAMPNWQTVLSYTQPEDRHVLSPVVLSHQKMTEGMEKLVRFMVGRVGFPKDFKSFCALSQFVQAEAIRTGVEHWRGRQFKTAGALYWQLNDCWPVASWSSVDYGRRKKGLWYYSQRFYAPVLPLLRLEDDTITLRAASDLLEAVPVTGRVTAYKLDGTKLAEQNVNAKLFANSVTQLDQWSLAQFGIGYSPRVLPMDASSTTYPVERNGELLDTVLYVELQAGEKTYRNWLVFERFRTLKLSPAELKVSVRGKKITVSSKVPAFGVFIETANDVDLSDNCLGLEPGVPVTIECSSAPGEVMASSITELVQEL